LGKHLHEVIGWPGPMTYRQFCVWHRWMVESLNQPDRHDYYAMQIAAEVRRTILQNKRQSITPTDFKLEWKPVKAAPKKATKEEIEANKRRWAAFLGVPLEKMRQIKPDGTLVE